MSVSTSGVEQKFSKTQLKFHSRIAASARLEDMALKVMQDAHEYGEDRLMRLARKVWLCCFPQSRTRLRPPRIDSGVKRSRGDYKKMYKENEREVVRKRRRAAASAAVAASAAEPMTMTGERRPDGWTEAHTKELEKQIERRHQRKLQLAAEGDVTGSTAERAAILKQDQQRLRDQRARERKAKRNDTQVNGMSIAQCVAWCQGKSAWIAPECRSEALAAALARLGMTRVRKVVGARVIVVSSPAEAMRSNCYRAPAALLGCCLVSPSVDEFRLQSWSSNHAALRNCL